jgi:NTE family protein
LVFLEANMKTALVLAGAVAKGAFEAGVLSVLAEREVPIDIIVATSAGALNAAVYATGVRFGRTRVAGEVLASLWADKADWLHIVSPTLKGIFGLQGASTSRALQKIVRSGMEQVAEGTTGPRGDVQLQLIATTLRGKLHDSKGVPTTTFEHVMGLHGPDFDSAAGRDKVAHTAVASGAFPILFVPVEVEGVGPCVDGGAVNNTPISWAIEAGAERVIVVTGNPLEIPAEPLSGATLLGKEVDIAINERLFRDLLQARRVNKKLEAIDEALTTLPEAERNRTRDAVRLALGWSPLDILEIRPENPLAGDAFSGLHDRTQRLGYLDVGRAAAHRALT